MKITKREAKKKKKKKKDFEKKLKRIENTSQIVDIVLASLIAGALTCTSLFFCALLNVCMPRDTKFSFPIRFFNSYNKY